MGDEGDDRGGGGIRQGSRKGEARHRRRLAGLESANVHAPITLFLPTGILSVIYYILP